MGMVVPGGSGLQESRPSSLKNHLVKRGVLVRLTMGGFVGLGTHKSQETTKDEHNYRVYLEAGQSVQSMKLPLAAYSTGNSAAAGA